MSAAAAPRIAGRVLLVDDEEAQRIAVSAALALREPGLYVGLAATYGEAESIIKAGGVEVLVTDYRLGGPETGADLAERLRELSPGAVAVVITAYGGISTVRRLLELVRAGVVVDYVEKPFDIDRDLAPAIERALAARAEATRHRETIEGSLCPAVAAAVDRAEAAVADLALLGDLLDCRGYR